MDSTLKGYRKLSPDNSFNEVEKLLTDCQKISRSICVLWHPDTLGDPRWIGWERVFS